MLLTYQLALVALDDEGSIGPEAHPGLDIGLAAGLLLELALSGCVDVDAETIAVRHGDFTDQLLSFAVVRIAGRSPSSAAQLLSEIEAWPGGMRRAVFDSMGNLGLGTFGEVIFEPGRAIPSRRFVPTDRVQRWELVTALEEAATTLAMTEDTATLLALALACGAWVPPEPEPGEPEVDPNLLQLTIDRIPRFTRAPVAAVIQAVAELTRKAHGHSPVVEPASEEPVVQPAAEE